MPSKGLSSVPDDTGEQDMAYSTSAVYLTVWGQTLPLTISFISLEVATPSTTSKPKTQVAVDILQVTGETSAKVMGNKRTTIWKHWNNKDLDSCWSNNQLPSHTAGLGVFGSKTITNQPTHQNSALLKKLFLYNNSQIYQFQLSWHL